MDALVLGLHIARQEFCLLVDVLDDAFQHLIREGVQFGTPSDGEAHLAKTAWQGFELYFIIGMKDTTRR